jgi:hypothetical protein
VDPTRSRGAQFRASWERCLDASRTHSTRTERAPGAAEGPLAVVWNVPGDWRSCYAFDGTDCRAGRAPMASRIWATTCSARCTSPPRIADSRTCKSRSTVPRLCLDRASEPCDGVLGSKRGACGSAGIGSVSSGFAQPRGDSNPDGVTRSRLKESDGKLQRRSEAGWLSRGRWALIGRSP